jgi:hypothetical protein
MHNKVAFAASERFFGSGCEQHSTSRSRARPAWAQPQDQRLVRRLCVQMQLLAICGRLGNCAPVLRKGVPRVLIENEDLSVAVEEVLHAHLPESYDKTLIHSAFRLRGIWGISSGYGCLGWSRRLNPPDAQLLTLDNRGRVPRSRHVQLLGGRWLWN